MALAAGTRLGAYEILGQIGAGGMGEVYRARDTRLERTVAIKVLNSQLTASAELRARFEREAKIVSQLQHPHICVLHDVGSENGTEYLVMEFLDGEALAEKVKRGPLPTSELLKIAVEIADALTKAHKAGIIHRDLKPGNVMLTKSGAKLLDFGLAKPMAASAVAASSGSASVFAAAATMTSPASPLSSAGTVIGTVQYMAPEQIQGQEADARSDVFAFGVVLYEMATGKRAFEGKTQSSIVGQILAVDPPPIASLQPMSPPALSRLVSTCLAKDPDERFQTIHDVKLRLQEIAETPEFPQSSTKAALPGRTLVALFACVAVTLFALATVMVFSFLKKTPTAQPTQFQVDLGALQVVWQTTGSRVAISPDGRTAVMLLHGDTIKPQLFVRRMDSLAVTAIPGTEGGTQPFFSPDGQWLGYSAGGKLRKQKLSGGVPVTICTLPFITVNATWGDNNTIVFGTGDVLYKVSSEGGTPQKLELGAESFRWPQFLPGSREMLVTVRREGRYDIDLVHLDSLKYENLIRDGSWSRYLASGRIVYAQYNSGGDSAGFTGGLLAVPFDLKSLKRTGSPEPVLQDVQVGTAGAGFYDISTSGTLVYMTGGPESNSLMDMMWLDSSGKVTPVGAPAHHIHSLRLSPDEKSIAFDYTESNDVYTYDIARKNQLRFTFDKHSHSAIFTPDGKRIIYASGLLPHSEIWTKSVDGTGEAAQLFQAASNTAFPDSVSPDGATLAYHETFPQTASDMYFASLRGDAKPHPFLKTEADEREAEFSPDGKFIAYESNESGLREIYVRSVNGSGVWQVSSEESRAPRWSKDGTKLYYVADGSRLMATDVTTSGTSFSFSNPRLLFEAVDFFHGGYDVTRDGRFLWARLSPNSSIKQLRVIENFDAEIARHAATPQP